MLTLSRFLLRTIGVWIIVIGFGSLLLASRVSAARQQTFHETLLSQNPGMDPSEALALLRSVGEANESIIRILAISSLVWMGVVGVLARGLEVRIQAGEARQSGSVEGAERV